MSAVDEAFAFLAAFNDQTGDCTAAIQTLIDAGVPLSAIPPGLYRLDSSIHFRAQEGTT